VSFPVDEGARVPGRQKRVDWRPTFLAAYAQCHTVTEACAAASIARQTARERRRSDPEFARMWDEVVEADTEVLEREAFRRAALEHERPIYQGGELVGTERVFSDNLLMFLLKSRRPEVYRDNAHVELGAAPR
jgi:hypothetical protein